MLPPLINVPRRSSRVPGIDDDGDENFHPHGTFLTREKTGFDPVYVGKKRVDPMLRRAYIQLDLLRPGDIFVRILGDCDVNQCRISSVVMRKQSRIFDLAKCYYAIDLIAFIISKKKIIHTIFFICSG